MSIGDKWQQFKATAKGLFRRPAMIGTPPSARPMWHDPAAHARDFAERYAEPMDYLAAQRMMELGIPNPQIVRPAQTMAAGGALSSHMKETAAAWSGIRSMLMPG